MSLNVSDKTLHLFGALIATGITLGFGISLFTDGIHWLRITAVVVGVGASISLYEKWFDARRRPSLAPGLGLGPGLESLGAISSASLSTELLQAVLTYAGLDARREESGLLRTDMDGYSVYLVPRDGDTVRLSSVFGIKPGTEAAAADDYASRWKSEDTPITATAFIDETAMRFDQDLPLAEGLQPLDLLDHLREFRQTLDSVPRLDTDSVLT